MAMAGKIELINATHKQIMAVIESKIAAGNNVQVQRFAGKTVIEWY